MNSNNKLSKLLFDISYFIYLYCIFSSRVIFTKEIIDILQVVSITFLLIVIFLQNPRYKTKTLIICIIYGLLQLFSYSITKSNQFIILFLFIVASKDIKEDEFIKKDLKFKLFLLIFLTICWLLGFSENVIKYRDDGKIRNSIGFNHPNSLGLCLFSICCGITYVNYNKKNIVKFIFPIISLIICTIICDSRAAQIGIILLIIMQISLPYLKNKQKLLKFINISPLILLVLSYFITIQYGKGSGIAIELNKISNTRVFWMYTFYENYGINLFGHFFESYGSDVAYAMKVLDNAYMNLLIHYGLINTIIIVFTTIKLLKNAQTNKKYNIYIYMIPMLFYGLMEKNLFSLELNGALIYYSEILFFKNQKNKGAD